MSPAPALMLKDCARGAPFNDFNDVLDNDRLIQLDENEMNQSWLGGCQGRARAPPNTQ